MSEAGDSYIDIYTDLPEQLAEMDSELESLVEAGDEPVEVYDSLKEIRDELAQFIDEAGECERQQYMSEFFEKPCSIDPAGFEYLIRHISKEAEEQPY